MDEKAGPSSGRSCLVCENVKQGWEMFGETCQACHLWFNSNIQFYNMMDKSSLCKDKMSGTYCPNNGCRSCKVEKYMSYNPFYNTTTMKCAVCKIVTYVNEENAICSTCETLWEQRNSYIHLKKCSCNPVEGKVCQVCCLKRLVQYMKEKELKQSSGESNNFSTEPNARNDTNYFYSGEFNVKCNISIIPKHLQEKAMKQLTKQGCLVSIKNIVLPTARFYQEDDCASSTSSNLNTNCRKRKRIESLFNDTSDEEEYQTPKKTQQVPPVKQTQVYDVESISDTCVRFKKPATLPCKSQSVYEQVYNSSSSSDASSSSSSETSPRSESSNPVSELSSSVTIKNLHIPEPAPSENVVSCHTFPDANICSNVTSPLPSNAEDEKSPIFFKKSQATKTAQFSNDQNLHAPFNTQMKKDESVQTEGFYEDLLGKVSELHKHFIVIQETIHHSRLSPSQNVNLLREAVKKVIEFCEPVTLRNSIAPHFSSSFASKPGGSCLQSTHVMNLAGSTQGGTKASTTPTVGSFSQTAKMSRAGPKSKKSLKLSKESSIEKSPVVILNRLTSNDLRRYGVELHDTNLPSAKAQFGKRSRKTSQNSESSFSTRDSISEDASNSSPAVRSSFTKQASTRFNPESLDYEDDSLELTQNSAFKRAQDQASSKHGKLPDRAQETKGKNERKASKERQRTKSGEKEKKPQKREKRNSESEKTQATNKISKEHDSKDGKTSENAVPEPSIRNYRIPKTNSVLSAPPSVGLPSLVQENLDRLKKGPLVPSANATPSAKVAPQEILHKPSYSTVQAHAKPESLPLTKASLFQDSEKFNGQNLPKPSGGKNKSILNICPSRKANGKTKVQIDEDLNSVRCISPIRRPLDTMQAERLPQDQNQPPLSEGYVAVVLDELGYVPESSPRPLVKGIRPFHPPKIRSGNNNPSVAPSVAETKATPTSVPPAPPTPVPPAPPTPVPPAPPKTTEPRYKRSWNRLSSSSSSDSESSSPSVSDSESDSDETTSVDNPLSPVLAAKSFKAPAVQEPQPYSTDSSSSSSSEASYSPSLQSSGKFREPAHLVGSETSGTSDGVRKTAQIENRQRDSSEAAASPARCVILFSPRRASVPALLVSPYRKDAEEPIADSYHVIPTNGDVLKGVGDGALVHHEQDEEQENMADEQDDSEKREVKEEEEEDDILDINLNDDELFSDPMYDEEPSAAQANVPKKKQSSVLDKQNDRTSRPIEAPLEQSRSSLSIWRNPIPQEVLANRQPEPQNVSGYRRFPPPNSIPTARVMPQFETPTRRPPPPPFIAPPPAVIAPPPAVIAPPPVKDIAAIISKGMCLSFMNTGQCPPKPHETCAYYHEDDPDILFAVVRSYCENKKLLLARRLLGAMTNEQSPYRKYLKLEIGKQIILMVVRTLLEENKNDHKEFALSILVNANIPPYPELVEKAIREAPHSASAAHALKQLYEKFTKAQQKISKEGWEKIVEVLCSHKLWQETCAAIATALQAQRYYIPSDKVINYLFAHALQTKVVQRIEQVCDLLKGVGSQAFARLEFGQKIEILNTLMKGSNPRLLGIYKHLFESDKLAHHQPIPHAVPSHKQHAVIPGQNVTLQQNPSLLSNRNTMSAVHPMANRSAPDVRWPSSSEVSAILKQNTVSHPTNTAPSTIGRNLHFDTIPGARQFIESAHMRNVANVALDPRLCAASRSHGSTVLNGVESKLLMPPPALNSVPSANIVQPQAPDSNALPAAKSEVARALIVPMPSQALDQNMFHNGRGSVQQEAKDAENAIVNEQPSSSAPPTTSPLIKQLDFLFADQSFDDKKFEQVADFLMENCEEHSNGEFLIAHLVSLITTTPLFDAEKNEELEVSTITVRIVYAVLRDGDASTLPPKQGKILLDFVGRILCYLCSKYDSTSDESEKEVIFEEAADITLGCTPAKVLLEGCTKNPKVLIFIADCYVRRWTFCDPPQEEGEITEFVESITKALYILTEFHKVVADFNIEKEIIDYEHHVVNTIMDLMQLIISTGHEQPVINCEASSKAEIEGALCDYEMEATKNKQRFRIIVNDVE